MKQAGIILTILFALVAFVVGFGGTTVGLMVFRPSGDSHEKVHFVITQGESAAEIGNNLVKVGLIRNAKIFELYAGYKKLDAHLQAGVYNLSADMTMDQIINKLLKAQTDPVIITVSPGTRVTQYPGYFAGLPNFNAENFLTIAKTGVLPDGSKLWEKYWYVEQPQKNIYYALEGYLFPDTYYFDSTDDEVAAVKRMLVTLGEKLCPGPDDQPDAYYADKAQCLAHAATVGNNKTSIFAAMEKTYSTKDDVLALYKTLIIGSLTIRETSNPNDVPGITNVYLTRYLAIHGKTANTGEVSSMGSDPSAWYARDSETPPTTGPWWKASPVAGSQVATSNLYNTDVLTHHELPPGPIAAPTMSVIIAAASASVSKYFYFFGAADVNKSCDKVYYATTFDEMTNLINTKVPKCS